MTARMLEGRVAVVTGGGRGIGREISLLMAAHGARVVVNDLGGGADGSGGAASPAHDVAREIQTAGGHAVPSGESVTTMAGGARIVETAVDHFGRIDIVVNNAGIVRDRMIFNMTEEEWDAVIAVHLKGSFALTRAAARVTAKVPLRWVLMTPSHSSSVMLKIIRSRRIPALLTTMSTRPNVSTAVLMIDCPPAIEATES